MKFFNFDPNKLNCNYIGRTVADEEISNKPLDLKRPDFRYLINEDVYEVSITFKTNVIVRERTPENIVKEFGQRYLEKYIYKDIPKLLSLGYYLSQVVEHERPYTKEAKEYKDLHKQLQNDFNRGFNE